MAEKEVKESTIPHFIFIPDKEKKFPKYCNLNKIGNVRIT